MKEAMRTIFITVSVLLFLSLIGYMVGCARFNTFYNAQQYFNQAEKARAASEGAQPSSSTADLYDKAIKKASKILTFHPKSRLVDDALLLMGKAFYGKKEYLKAVRKFSELIDNFPKSDLVFEASFWRGTCYYATGDYARAEKSLTGIVTQKRARKWAAEAQFLLAEMAFQEERYRYAIEEYGKVVEHYPKNVKTADAQYRIGQCLTLLGRPSEARIAYDRVFKYDPHDTLRLNATFSIGQSLREEGRYEQAIDIFKELLKNSRNIEYYSAIQLEIAECEAEKGALMEAVSEYEGIIADYPKSESSAEAHYRLGLVYLNLLGDLSKAKEHLDAVKTEYAKSRFTEESQHIAKNIEALTKLYDQLSPSPSDSADSKPESESTEQKTNEEQPDLDLDDVLAEMGGDSDSLFFEETPLDTATDSTVVTEVAQPQKPPEASGVEIDTAEIHFKLAELYLLQFTKADSALKHYEVVANTYPESDYGAKSAFALAWIEDMILNDPLSAQEAYLHVIETFSNTPYDKAARLALGEISTEGQDVALGRSEFEEAERMFFQGGDTGSLIAAYQNIIDHYPDSPYAPKAGYSIAWILEYVKSDRHGAEQAYQAVLDTYPDTDYAKEAKIKLGKAQRAKKEKTTPQQQEQKESEEEKPLGDLTLEDIVRQMLEEGPMLLPEPEMSSQIQ